MAVNIVLNNVNIYLQQDVVLSEDEDWPAADQSTTCANVPKSVRAVMLTEIDVAIRIDGYLKSNYLGTFVEIHRDKVNYGFTSILAGLQNVSPIYKVNYLRRIMAVYLSQNVKEL